MRFAVRLITLLAGLCVLGGTTQAEPQKRLGEYCLTHIFTPDFDHQLDFHVTGINDKGEIVGYGAGPPASQGAFLWRKGQFIDLGAQIGHAVTFAFGINDHGDVVGSYSDDGREFQAFLLRHGRVIDIQGVPGVGSTHATAVNNKRQVIVGRGVSNFMWERGSATLLEPLEPGGQAFARGMNDRGIIVGASLPPDGFPARPVLWQDSTVMNLGMPEVAESADTVDVNNRGQVAVNVSTHIDGGDVRLPFIWQEGEFVELPVMGDSPEGALLSGINDQGVAVGGTSRTVGDSGEAFPTVWRDGQAADLSTLICSGDPLQPYVDLDPRLPLLINNRGQIVTSGIDLRIAPWHGVYLLTPKR
jgi:probable HAF family extracellular repeat protein